MKPGNAHIFTHLSELAERKHREARRAQALHVKQQVGGLFRLLGAVARGLGRVNGQAERG